MSEQTLLDRAYAQIGSCSCPPVAELCTKCELLRELITEVERLREVDAQLDAIHEVADSYRLIEDTQILEILHPLDEYRGQ
jgi:hypothetical protein